MTTSSADLAALLTEFKQPLVEAPLSVFLLL
jgi:hypothetical protein